MPPFSASSCRIVGGGRCKFPFTWEGRTFSSCLKRGSLSWCPHEAFSRSWSSVTKSWHPCCVRTLPQTAYGIFNHAANYGCETSWAAQVDAIRNNRGIGMDYCSSTCKSTSFPNMPLRRHTSSVTSANTMLCAIRTGMK